MSKLPLNQRIQHFYDQSTQLWLDTWGEHMHHGYYGPDGKERKGRQEAQIDLVEEMLKWGDVQAASHILDAGCGVGGSARLLARRFDAKVLGVTLSPVQAKAAADFSKKAGLDKQVEVRAQDMMALNKADGPFDLIWSMESAEHIADKQQLLHQFYEMLLPGGQLLMATWCHRNGPSALTARNQQHLEKLYRIYNLPPMVSGDELLQMAEQAGFTGAEAADWSDAVAPFWQEVIRSALEWRNFRLLVQTNMATIRGAWAMRYMRKGYKEGLIRFVVLKGRKLK